MSSAASVKSASERRGRVAAAVSPTPRDGWIVLPNTYEHHLDGFCCFGCAQSNASGLRLQMEVHGGGGTGTDAAAAAAAAAAVSASSPAPPLFRTSPFLFSSELSGFPGLAQGGLQGAAMDCLAEWACMYLTNSIGITTQFQVEFVKGVPAAPAASQPQHSVARATMQADLMPQSLGLLVQAVCRPRPQTHPRTLVLDLVLESASVPQQVFSRGEVHMLLPSPSQISRLFGTGTEGQRVAKQVQHALDIVPRPLKYNMPKEIEQKQQRQTDTTAAAKETAPKDQKQQRAATASSQKGPTSYAHLVSPAVWPEADASDWVELPDPLSALIPGYSCFGCSTSNSRGLRCRFSLHRLTGAVRSFLCPSSSLSGFPGMLHGGVALVALDCAAAWAAMVTTGRMGLTNQMHTVYLQAAPVPQTNQRRVGGMHGQQEKATATTSAAASVHSCQSHLLPSPSLLSPSESPFRLMTQAEVVSISADGRTATVVAGLYDVSIRAVQSDATAPLPRLCMSSLLRFTLASPSIIRRLLGEEFEQPVEQAMKEMQQVRRQIDARNSKEGRPNMKAPTIEHDKAADSKSNSGVPSDTAQSKL